MALVLGKQARGIESGAAPHRVAVVREYEINIATGTYFWSIWREATKADFRLPSGVTPPLQETGGCSGKQYQFQTYVQ